MNCITLKELKAKNELKDRKGYVIFHCQKDCVLDVVKYIYEDTNNEGFKGLCGSKALRMLSLLPILSEVLKIKSDKYLYGIIFDNSSEDNYYHIPVEIYINALHVFIKDK